MEIKGGRHVIRAGRKGNVVRAGIKEDVNSGEVGQFGIFSIGRIKSVNENEEFRDDAQGHCGIKGKKEERKKASPGNFSLEQKEKGGILKDGSNVLVSSKCGVRERTPERLQHHRGTRTKSKKHLSCTEENADHRAHQSK